LLAQEMETPPSPTAEDKDSCVGDSIGAAPGEGYLHRGKWVDEFESTDVIAQLTSFSADLVYVHMQDHTYVYRVSIFEVVEPEDYRGEKITIHVRPSGPLESVWTEVGRIYAMSVPVESLRGLGGFVTPDLITIFKEHGCDEG